MQVEIKLFASLRQKAGWPKKKIELPEGATIQDLIEALTQQESTLTLMGGSIYAAVNQEYVKMEYPLQDGDTVALFPPVSGGNLDNGALEQPKLFEITDQPLSLDDVAARVSKVYCGAITTFAGVVRGETAVEDGQRDTDFLEYESFAEMAEKMMAQIGDEIQTKWPKVAAVSILHRIGRCEIGEASVVIAVSTPHRGDGCFAACQYAIERLKAIVPIWKQENWSDGQVWVEGPRQPELELSQPG